jgi:hypothetical protein
MTFAGAKDKSLGKALLSSQSVSECSFLTTLGTHDWCILSPHFEHFLEPRIAFYGIHAIILTVLVYFHQGMQRTDSDGDKLGNSNDPSSDLDGLFSS